MALDFETEYGPRGGVRFEIRNPPRPGAKLLTNSGERVVFDGMGMAGMLECTRERDDSQQLYFPQDINCVLGNAP